jgi:hypothetical protein
MGLESDAVTSVQTYMIMLTELVRKNDLLKTKTTLEDKLMFEATQLGELNKSMLQNIEVDKQKIIAAEHGIKNMRYVSSINRWATFTVILVILAIMGVMVELYSNWVGICLATLAFVIFFGFLYIAFTGRQYRKETDWYKYYWANPETSNAQRGVFGTGDVGGGGTGGANIGLCQKPAVSTFVNSEEIKPTRDKPLVISQKTSDCKTRPLQDCKEDLTLLNCLIPQFFGSYAVDMSNHDQEVGCWAKAKHITNAVKASK